jgi:hypothetical protein
MKAKSTKVFLDFLERIARRDAGLKIRRQPVAKEQLDAHRVVEMDIP